MLLSHTLKIHLSSNFVALHEGGGYGYFVELHFIEKSLEHLHCIFGTTVTPQILPLQALLSEKKISFNGAQKHKLLKSRVLRICIWSKQKRFPGHPKAKVYYDQDLPVRYSIRAKNI